MILVVDVTKGIQTQTAECLVIGEIVCPERLIVALNKVDQVEPAKREQAVHKMTKRLRATLERTAFKRVEVVAVAAKTDSEEGHPIGVGRGWE